MAFEGSFSFQHPILSWHCFASLLLFQSAQLCLCQTPSSEEIGCNLHEKSLLKQMLHYFSMVLNALARSAQPVEWAWALELHSLLLKYVVSVTVEMSIHRSLHGALLHG